MHEADQSDGQLLAEFATTGSQQAFAQIVERHGAMVHAVARRVVGDHHDAEDVAQAAFLALARKAASKQQIASVGAWLHHVAWCLAQDAGKIRRRREDHEAAAMRESEQSVPAEVDRQAFQAELDAAINQLAERYRRPLVLFHLEGQSLQQTAECLGLNLNTVCTQLARARELLRQKLVRRGVTVSSVGVLLTLLSAESGAATLPATFVSATVKAATLAATGKLAAGVGTGVVSAKVVTLTKGALNMLFWNSVKTAAVITTAAVVVAGGGALVAKEVVQKAAEQPPAAVQSAAPRPVAAVPVVSISDILNRQVTLDRRRMPFIALANRMNRDTGLKFAVVGGQHVRGNVRIEPGKVRVGDLLDTLAKAMNAELDVRELHGGVCAIFWSRTDAELSASLEKLAASADETERCAAARWLPALGSRSALEAGAKLLADPSPRVRQYAAWGIGRSWQLMSYRGTDLAAWDNPLSLLVPPEAGRAVAEDINKMAEAPAELAWQRFDSLARLSAALRLESAMPGLRKMAKHQLEHALFYQDGAQTISVGWQAHATGIICRINGRDAEEAIAELWKDAKSSSIIVALADLDSPWSRKMLIAALDDKEPSVVRSAARSLGLLGAREAEEPLLKVLEKPWDGGDGYVLKAVAGALLRIDAAKHVETAKKVLSGIADPWQRVGFCSVLSKEPSAGAWLAPYAEDLLGTDYGSQVRSEALSVLARVGTEKSVPRIAPLLSHQDVPIKRQACAALSGIGGPAATAALQDALKSDDAELRAAACWAIVDLEDESLVRGLLEAKVKDPDAKVGKQATDSLRYLDAKTARLDSEEVKRALADLDGRLRGLKSPDTAGRLAAIRGNPGGADCDPRLVAPLCALAVSDPDEGVRLAAAKKLFTPSAGYFTDPAVADTALKALKEGTSTELRSAAKTGLIWLGLTKRPDVAAAVEGQ